MISAFAGVVPVSGQTYSRKIDADPCNAGGIAESASKFATDLRLLQHLKEVEEPFEKNQIGSSAHRTSAIRCAPSVSVHWRATLSATA